MECLAAVNAIKKFRSYLELQAFKVITDHSSLHWLMNQPIARWSLSLAGYNFEIEHRKGSEHVFPDAHSSCLEDDSELEFCVVDLDLNSSK